MKQGQETVGTTDSSSALVQLNEIPQFRSNDVELSVSVWMDRSLNRSNGILTLPIELNMVCTVYSICILRGSHDTQIVRIGSYCIMHSATKPTLLHNAITQCSQ